MKIGIITHHDVHNHGAHLQNYSLALFLRTLGHEVETLKHRKNYDFLEDFASEKYNITFRSIPFYLGYLFQNGLKQTFFNVTKKAQLRKFRGQHALVGRFYSKANDLDCVIIGSDEVFSIEAGLNPFFWGMGVPCKNIYSYAGSFGPSTTDFLIEKNAVEFVRAGIKSFKKISVRDKNSQTMIEKLSGVKPPIVCDPVFLNESLPLPGIEGFKKNRYLLVYSYDKNMNSPREIKAIKNFAKSNSLSTLSVGFYHDWCDNNINTSPLGLINYFKEAEFTLTDTFHGTILSIISNRPFATKIRGNHQKISYLLSEYNLVKKSVSDFEDLDLVLKDPIDYQTINSMITRNRNFSKEFILSCLNSTANEK